MPARLAQHIGKPVPQTEPLPGQVPNSAGGYAFPVDDWKRLDRFLILGSDGGTYYVSEKKLTLDNAKAVERCVAADGVRTVNRIVEISDEGRAPKNDPALLALAIAAKYGNVETRRAAYAALPRVARIGTHLFHFADYLKAVQHGWGRGTTRAFSNWYLERSLPSLVTQGIKYQQRDGWSQRDILRKAHPKTDDAFRNQILRWMVKGWEDELPAKAPDGPIARVWAFEKAKRLTSPSDKKALVKLITEYDLPHECVPNEMKGHPEIWEALLPGMGLTALIRNLGKMTSVGLVKPLSATAKLMAERLGDRDQLKAARIHPLNVLVALRTYSNGHGDKGSLRWEPVQSVVDALDAAFYLAFKCIEPTGKRHMLALDVSGSMSSSMSNMPISCREAAAAMALVTANVESDTAIFGFGSKFMPLKISARDRLDKVVDYMARLDFQTTDCSLPMVHATKDKLAVDAFCVYTDSETYAGKVHPPVALAEYRKKIGRNAKCAVIGMVSNGFTIADPNDGGMMDVVGFDTATPAVLADFIR